MPIQRRLGHAGTLDDLVDPNVANSAGRKHRVRRFQHTFTSASASALRRNSGLLGH
jgi:hypothetical protein